MDWSEIDLAAKLWRLPAERAKNDEPHIVPLSDLIVRELEVMGAQERGLVFTTNGRTPVSGFSKAKRALDADMLAIMKDRHEEQGGDPSTVVIPDWRLHDLRRTGATNLQALGVPIEVTEAVLNHISGTRAGIAGIYNRYKYEPEKKAALEAWSRRLQVILIDGTG